MTSNRCVNFSCPSDSNAKLIQARECVCMYYNVPFKSNQMVCRVCLKECILMYKKMGEQIKNKESILENKFPKFFETIVLSESEEEDNVASTSYEHPQESQFSDALETIFKKMNINNLMEVQKKHFQDYVEAQKSSINAADKEISNMAEEIENIFDSVYKELYKYDNSRNFKFQEEVNIIEIDEVDIANIDEGGNIVHNEDEVHTNDKRDESSLYLPQEEILETCLLKSGDKVYAKKLSQLQPWYEATVLSIVGDMFFRISFCDNSEQYVSYNNLAYTHTMKEEYQIGNRVIAKFKDVDVKMTNNFYPGIIAELPNNFNNKKYMIFFIDGYTQYAYHEDIRILCHQSPELSDDIHENVKKFIKAYLDKYPDIPMVHFNKNQLVRTELDTKWYLAKVINIDASLVQLKFLDFENMHTEWIFRGSYRLGPIYNHINKIQEKRMHYIKTANVNKILNRPYIEFGYTTENLIRIDCNESNSIEDSSTIDFINIPSSRPKPVIYKDHQCNHFCMIWVNYDVSQTKNLNALSIPLHFGFQRHMVKDESQELKTVKYTTPCGRSISNENEMYNYLKIVGYGENQMTIDLFNFDHNVDPLAVFKVTKYYKNIYDITNGKEFKPVSAVNCVNNSIPPSMKYITKCEPKPGVKLNLNAKFLCGCDCTDNCDDKRKCFCWKLTLDSVKNYPKIFKNQNIGYNYKRLHEPVYTGIYECNINCRCLKTCSNRVVQEPFATSLQLFLTEKKGWGVRTLADIPKGAFICTFVGEICTEADAEKEGVEFGDAYLADLDYIETAEDIKNGYESDVESASEMESFSETENSSEDEEFIPGGPTNKKIKLSKSNMSLKQKNTQNTNSKIDGKRQLSKLNSQKSVKTTNKTLRSYLDKNCGVYIVNARTSGNIGRYFNHSCDPNVFFQNVFVDTHNLEFPWVAYFSLSNISAGTELCLDYGYEVGSVKGKKLKCFCGSNNCRGRLL